MTRLHGPGRPGRGGPACAPAGRDPRRASRHASPRDGRGAVTAELALGLPLLVSVTVGLVWMVAAGAAQVRAVDASRETARALARGDETSAAVAVGRRIAPEGAEVVVAVEGDRVRVRTTAAVAGPGGLFAVLPPIRVRSEAVALLEEHG